jgi:DNA-binding NarL/FixJ family response regulator
VYRKVCFVVWELRGAQFPNNKRCKILNVATLGVSMILIVDTDLNFLSLLQSYLNSRNYPVVVALDEQRALDILLSQPLDAIVIDNSIDNSIGNKFCSETKIGLLQKIRRQPQLSWIPVILLSTKASKQERLTALNLGVNAYFIKPFNLEEFTAQLESALRLSHRLKAQRSPRHLQVPEAVKLTHTEILVAELVVEGKSNQEIAQFLNISKRTIESHISHMLKKTGLANRTELTRWIMETEG